MKIVALDDERISLNVLVESIRSCIVDAEIIPFTMPEKLLLWMDEGNSFDICFLDIEMQEMNGIEVAKRIKNKLPQTNIIFTTGYGKYRADAFKLHASGYLTKPILPDDVRDELDNLRYLSVPVRQNKIWIQTFGNFEIFYEEKPLPLKPKSKETLAYLVDREGANVTNNELYTVLYEGEFGHEDNLKKIKKSLIDTLKKIGCDDIIIVSRGALSINLEKIDCDLFDYKKGLVYAINRFYGEYMEQYSWSELKKGELMFHQNGNY